jgi:hypothetical protein
MNQKTTKSNLPPAQSQQTSTKKPNERAGFSFSSAVTIKDPDTGNILVQLRCS